MEYKARRRHGRICFVARLVRGHCGHLPALAPRICTRGARRFLYSILLSGQYDVRTLVSSAKRVFAFSVLAVGGLVALLSWNPAEPRHRGPATPLTIYCAAGLKPAVEPVAREYQRSFGVPVQLQYGGSGTLLSNLRVAGRGDLFIAADESYLEIARSNRLAAEIIPLAHMTPVLAVRAGNPKGIHTLADLLRPDVAVAMANPDAAAVGKIVRDLLRRSGEWAVLEKRIKVFKPTVNDVANDLKLGTVDVGIIWDATARQYPELEAVHLSALDSAKNSVAVAVLTCSAQPTAALRFARYLGARDRGLRELARAGYQAVEGDVWAEQPAVVLYSGGVNRLAIEGTLDQFERREGAKVTRVYNGCGILVSQIKSGQRPDAFFACDASFLNDVRDRFANPVELSETDMVLLVPKGNPKNLHAPGDLAQAGLRLGVGNAKQTALGALTEKGLKEAGLLEAVMANVKVQTPTADLLVNQMRTGSLDAVIVFAANTSQVRGTLDVIPLKIPGGKAIQPYAVSRDSDHRLLMDRLLAALQTAQSQQQFEAVGFRWRSGQNAP